MFIIEKPQILYLLLLIIPFTAAFLWNMGRRRKKLARFGDYEGMLSQIPGYSGGKPYLKFILSMFAFALLAWLLLLRLFDFVFLGQSEKPPGRGHYPRSASSPDIPLESLFRGKRPSALIGKEDRPRSVAHEARLRFLPG